MSSLRRTNWIVWGVLLIAGSAYLSHRLLRGDARIFLPGETTHGHHQIELSCEACHTERFASQDDIQKACVGCHGASLATADDSHPKSKFTDPRNADRVALLDARRCETCHREHVPEQTLAMGLTLPADYCHRCHEKISDERPSHTGLPFDSCASGGCHNFHDNRALYEDFLIEHANDPWLAAEARVRDRDATVFAAHAGPALDYAASDAPAHLAERARWSAEWVASSHARAGVNCSACHVVSGGETGAKSWSDHPGIEGCRDCHGFEVEGFLAGRHGMRVAAGLGPMRPELARIPMREDAHGALGCATCHAAHAFDTRRAAAEACLGCHDDAHTLAWRDTTHAALHEAELAGDAPPGSGVSCATCHLPRVEVGRAMRVQHDQNDALRPNEKMIRPVCMACHGLSFSLDALADAGLVRANFRGRPRQHVESIDMAVRATRERRDDRPPGKTRAGQKEEIP